MSTSQIADIIHQIEVSLNTLKAARNANAREDFFAEVETLSDFLTDNIDEEEEDSG